MAKDNTIKKEETEDIWDGSGRSRAPQKAGVNQEQAQRTRPENFDFDKAINFEGIGEGGDISKKQENPAGQQASNGAGNETTKQKEEGEIKKLGIRDTSANTAPARRIGG